MEGDLDPRLCDEDNAYGPLGNDTGADVRSLYLRWRQDGKRRDRFLPQLLREWEMADGDWDDLDPERIASQLAESPYQRLVRDDLVIGLAFAQYLVDGKVEAEVKRRALVAIERQGLECVLAFRDWDDRGERERALTAMRRFLASSAA